MTSRTVPQTTSARTHNHGPLPRLCGPTAVLRDLTETDAPSLFAHISTAMVARHLAPPPQSVEAFRDFIRWAHDQREQGRHLCFGIVPRHLEHAVGFIQVWPVESRFSTAEWGFAIGADYWGTGLFVEAADLVLHFVFETMDVQRLEARCGILNARGHGVLTKLGAKPEGVLRGSRRSNGTSRDHLMWSLLADEWRERRQTDPASVDGAR